MVNHKKLKDYFNQGLRKIKHRKGFGVHSPFAYSFITEVIEEKLPYYKFSVLREIFTKQAPLSYKTACLLFRIANRFRFHSFAELNCDGGYSMLPLLLADSRNHVSSLASPQVQDEVRSRLKLFKIDNLRYSFFSNKEQIQEASTFDMLLINVNPFQSADPQLSVKELVEWTLQHTHEDSVIFVMGIQVHQPLESFWDMLCDHDDISITMDLYNNGLAIRKPHFFKQHYIVSF